MHRRPLLSILVNRACSRRQTAHAQGFLHKKDGSPLQFRLSPGLQCSLLDEHMQCMLSSNPSTDSGSEGGSGWSLLVRSAMQHVGVVAAWRTWFAKPLACSHGSKIQVKRVHKTQLVQGERLELKLIALACLPHLESPSAGCERYRSVKEANRLARRLAYLHLGLALLEQTHATFHSPFCFAKLRIEYNWRKGVSYVIENPQSSLLWQYRCLQDPGPC